MKAGGRNVNKIVELISDDDNKCLPAFFRHDWIRFLIENFCRDCHVKSWVMKSDEFAMMCS